MDFQRRQYERMAGGDPEDAILRRSAERTRVRLGDDHEASRLNVADLACSRSGLLLIATRGHLEWRTASGVFLEAWAAPVGYKNSERSLALGHNVVAVSNWGAPLTILDFAGQMISHWTPPLKDLEDSTWQPCSIKEKASPHNLIHALQFDVDGSLLIFSKAGQLQRLDIHNKECRALSSWEYKDVEYFHAAIISPDSKEIFGMGGIRRARSSPILRYHWLTQEKSKLIIPVEEDADFEPRMLASSPILAAALSPGNDTIALGNKSGQTALLSLSEKREVEDSKIFQQTKPGVADLLKMPGRSLALSFGPLAKKVYAVNVAGDLTIYCARQGSILQHEPNCFLPGYFNSSSFWLHRAELKIEPSIMNNDLIVKHRNPKGPSHELEVGDRVLALNGKSPRGCQDFFREINEAPAKSLLSIEREDQQFDLEIDLEISSYQ